MSADALSQDEIDALLKGASGAAEVSAAEPPELTSQQSTALSVYTKAMAGTLGDMIGTFLATSSAFNPLRPTPRTSRSTAEIVHGNLVYVIFSHQGRLRGDTALIFLQEDACKIGGTMVGDPAAAEFSDMVADAFKEVMSTVLGNLNTALSGPAGGSVTTTPVQVEPMDASAENFTAALNGSEQLVMLPYEMNVANTLKGRCWQLFSLDLVESLEVLAEAPAPAPKSATAPSSVREPVPTVKAAPVQFDSLTEEPPPTPAPSNLDLLMDIELEVRVELGRSSLKIRDVLKLGTGSVVELDKLAGEPVDLLVNDVIFAKGEVVVIDENFGVRITDILSLADRVKTFGERKA